MLKSLIVGIDPGTNLGLAVIDDNGNVIDKLSGKNIQNEDIIKYISDLKYAVLIATDKKEIPKTILDIASKLNIGVYSPKEDISLEIKNKYYQDENLKNIFENNHEFDAYISAIEALKKLKEIFEKAKRFSENQDEYIKILRYILKNRKVEVVAAKNNLREKEKEIKNGKKRKRRKKEKKDIEIVKVVIKNKKEQKEKEKIIEELNKKYIELLNDYNILSKILTERLKIDDNIIPKISFLYLNKLYYNKIFIDEFKEEYIIYYKNKDVKFFVKKEDLIEAKNILPRFYVIDEFKELKNFIIAEKFHEEKSNIIEKDIDEERLKKILKNYREHRLQNLLQ
jgi:predicted RNase H-like nuclease (RuvC/YqgF family)